MENPIFKLEGIVKTRGEYTDFVGPLDLILQLLRKNKIEIKDISVSLILEQYMAYFNALTTMDLDVASDFVAMASYLVYIKTKMLLSGDEEVDELNELINSLEQLKCRDYYAQIKQVSQPLHDMYRNGSALIVKPPEYYMPDLTYQFEHEVNELLTALLTLTDREAIEGMVELKTVRYPKPIIYSVTEKASEILGRIKVRGATKISTLIFDAQSRSEMVAIFVAVLELCRTGAIYLIGSDDELTLCASSADKPTAQVLSEFEDTPI